MRAPPICFDRVAAIYDKSRALPPRIAKPVEHRLTAVLRGGSVLDVGIGTARLVSGALADPSTRLVGIDVARAMVARARTRGADRIFLADARALPFKDRSFDRSLSIHLLHLVADWKRVLTEIARVTRLRYVSVLEFETATPDLSDEYRRLASEAGIDVSPPGLHERELAKRLTPDESLAAAETRYERPAEAVIHELESREFSAQWEVGAPEHERIIASIRSGHLEEIVKVQLSVTVVSWNTGRLRTFAEGQASTAGVF